MIKLTFERISEVPTGNYPRPDDQIEKGDRYEVELQNAGDSLNDPDNYGLKCLTISSVDLEKEQDIEIKKTIEIKKIF
jgi:hypothetical protein